MSQRPAAEPLPFPERVGRYEVLLPIASGGMATVYLARARGAGGFEREVALKLMHAHLRESAGFAQDLIEEAKLAVRIRHPNVVPVLDAGEDAFGVYLVMDYVEGDTLAGLMRVANDRGRRIPEAVGSRILCDALAGLHAAHELCDESGRSVGLVHRDFSPQNVLVGVDGASRLADFGVAKAAIRLGHTQTGHVKGKIGYMAPEQARGRPIDRRCDVWAAGITAWEIFAGRRMYTTSDVATLLDIVSRPPARLRSARPEASQALDEAIAHALSMSPHTRFPTAAAFARALGHAGVELADADEVGAFVRELCGSKLGKRRTRVAEVLQLRARMERIATGAGADAESAPSSRTAALAAEAPDAFAPEGGGTVQIDPSEATRTDTTSVTTPEAPHLGGRRRKLQIAAAALIAALSAVVMGTWTARNRDASEPPVVGESDLQTEAPAQGSLPEPPRVEATAQATSAALVPAASSSGSEVGAPASDPSGGGATARPAGTKRRPSPAKPTKAPLAPSPYDRK